MGESTGAWACREVQSLWAKLFWEERLNHIANDNYQRDHIEELHNQLDQFTKLLGSNDVVIEALLRRLLSEPVAKMLGDHGLEVLCPELGSRQPRLSARDLPRNRKYEYRTVVGHNKIHRVVEDNLLLVLTRLIETINIPLAEFLKRPKGKGRRGNELRRLLIDHAAHIYSTATGQ